jgi:deoxyribodipyrimidine photo-lyase
MQAVNIFWFRRDLRLHDNAGLFYALKDKNPVIPVFIFDRYILDELDDKKDRRVTDLKDYPAPIVEHVFARKRCLEVYSKAVQINK